MKVRFSPRYDFILGLIIGLLFVLLLIFSLNLGGLIVFTGDVAELTHQIFYWLETNLGWSIPLFISVLSGFVFYLYQLKCLLNTSEPLVSLIELEDKNHKLDKLVSIFFGIGVLWTAIGMRTALTAALGDMDSEMASSLGAWEILSRLVDGGILQAPSTTIVGGAGGYLMIIIKQWSVKKQISQIYRNLEQDGNPPPTYKAIHK